MKAKSALSVALAAGIASAAAASNTPTTLSPTQGNVKKAAHIYFNVATGERVVTVINDGQTSGADTGESTPIWSALVGNQCADAGFTTSFFFGVDNPGTTSLSTDVTMLDHGDIVKDSVVDCVHINWVVAHPDVDSDSDGTGDGVEGLAGQWIYWDTDNGREIDISTRTGLIGFTFTDLPGNIFGAGSLTGYTADIDLAATFTGTSLTFEICDTDSDPQDAAVHNPGIGNMDNNFDGEPDSDLDGDGFADWSWTIRFFQPGTVDFDSDGFPDGTPAGTDVDTIGVSFGAPAGTAVDNGDGTWTWDIDTSVPDAGHGAEDRFALFFPPDINDEILYAGGFFFGGFSCVADPDSGQYTPSAMFEHQFFGPGGEDPCPADLNDDGLLNFFDVSLFLSQFNMGGDYNGDGATNFFDVSAFLSDFNAGCP